jgi:hypothetical protein
MSPIPDDDQSCGFIITALPAQDMIDTAWGIYETFLEAIEPRETFTLGEFEDWAAEHYCPECLDAVGEAVDHPWPCGLLTLIEATSDREGEP